MLIKIKENCVLCGKCTECCPDTFFLDPQEGKIKIKNEKNIECAKKAADQCPMEAISINE